ncbi:hypothetical protein ACFYVR_06225 [Rhodococcus sp. NPDC003318]|uniref:hypothetical protein n=1 Tax=Rhodococcus sp. NPDC003318 TaxID=3364503 RepID=UPI0036B8BA17
MADDDDTSAGLTTGTRPPARRRASRSAGPPKEQQSPATPAAEKSPAAATVVDRPDTAVPAREPGSSNAPEVDAEKADSLVVQSVDAGSEGNVEPAEEGRGVEEPVPSARSRKRLAAWTGAAVLIVALVAASVWLLIERNAAHERDAQRNAFVQTARQTVLNLTTIKPETAKEDVDRILAGASGEFRSEFDGREDPFVSVVQEAGVTTVGKILESGLESEDGNTAKVLVAARADVSTPDGTQNGPRDFRMRVTVTDDGGTMTASKVEFVP